MLVCLAPPSVFCCCNKGVLIIRLFQGKPVTTGTGEGEKNRKLISELFSKSVYLYDANTFKLITKYDKQKDLMDDLKISLKTIIKYKD